LNRRKEEDIHAQLNRLALKRQRNSQSVMKLWLSEAYPTLPYTRFNAEVSCGSDEYRTGTALNEKASSFFPVYLGEALAETGQLH